MERRRRIALVVTAILAVIGLVAGLAWWDAVHPLRYLRAERVVTAQVVTRASRGRAGRDLSVEEIAELCRCLAAARSTEPIESPAAIRVELATDDFGRVEVEDLSGPGARAAIFAGGNDEKRFTLRSESLGRFLARLRAGLEGSGGLGGAGQGE